MHAADSNTRTKERVSQSKRRGNRKPESWQSRGATQPRAWLLLNEARRSTAFRTAVQVEPVREERLQREGTAPADVDRQQQPPAGSPSAVLHTSSTFSRQTPSEQHRSQVTPREYSPPDSASSRFSPQPAVSDGPNGQGSQGSSFEAGVCGVQADKAGELAFRAYDRWRALAEDELGGRTWTGELLWGQVTDQGCS